MREETLLATKLKYQPENLNFVISYSFTRIEKPSANEEIWRFQTWVTLVSL